MVGDGGDQSVVVNKRLRLVRVKDEKPGWVFSERHDRPVETMDVESRVDGRIHSDAANFTHVGKGKDVGDGLGVVPDLA